MRSNSAVAGNRGGGVENDGNVGDSGRRVRSRGDGRRRVRSRSHNGRRVGSRSGLGGQRDGLDTGGGGDGGGVLGRRSRASLDVEGVGVLEDAGVVLVLDDEAVEGIVAQGGGDVPGEGASAVGNAGWCPSQSFSHSLCLLVRINLLAMVLRGTWVPWVAPPISSMEMVPAAYLAGASHWMVKGWPAVMTWLLLGLVTGSKSGVWAKAVEARARKAGTDRVNRILTVEVKFWFYLDGKEKNEERNSK